MNKQKFHPGFRLSAMDGIILIAGGFASAYAMSVDKWLGFAIAFVVLHFFLFCNVLRMSRPLELIWAGVFVALAIATVAWDLVSRPAALVVSLVVTLIVAVIDARRPSYHGVGWQTLNPRLPEWWQNATSAGGGSAASPLEESTVTPPAPSGRP